MSGSEHDPAPDDAAPRGADTSAANRQATAGEERSAGSDGGPDRGADTSAANRGGPVSGDGQRGADTSASDRSGRHEGGTPEAADRITIGGDGPGGPLVVSGGETTLIATEALLAEAAVVQLVLVTAEGWRPRLEGIRLLDVDAAPGWTSDDPGFHIFAAGRFVDAAIQHGRDLAGALVSAAEGYGQAEQSAAQLAGIAQYSAAALGYGLGSFAGRFAPLLLLLSVSAVSLGGQAMLLGALLTGTHPADLPARLTEWLEANPRVLTNPVIAAALRLFVSSVDDAAAGAAGVPFPMAQGLGDAGLGVLGVVSSAVGVRLAARPFGLLAETPVSVARVGAGSAPSGPVSGPKSGPPATPVRAAPPAGIADLAARIPPPVKSGPQVRIERYRAVGGGSAWVVYIGGTADWEPSRTENPWDLTSDLSAVADQGAGSYRVVVQAMHEAGIGPGDPVIPVGHSQGGLVAAQLAASGDFNCTALTTFGAPIAQVPVPPEVATLAVEHSDDIVPALGGVPDQEAARLIARREVYFGRDVPAAEPIPAHSLPNYSETARMIDESYDPSLQRFRSQIADIVGSEPGEVTEWRGSREPG